MSVRYYTEGLAYDPVQEFQLLPCCPEYRVSNCGRVQSRKSGEWRDIQASKDQGGYTYVNLRLWKKKSKLFRVHVLVMLAFIGPRPPGLYVCHDNGDPADNRLENLKYATPKENSADRKRHGWQLYQRPD